MIPLPNQRIPPVQKSRERDYCFDGKSRNIQSVNI